MRKTTLLLTIGALVIAIAVPAGAKPWTEKVTFDVESATGGSGAFYMRGLAVGSDEHAAGSIEYYHPYQPGRANSHETRLRLVNLECMVVEPSTRSPGDFNVLVIGRLRVLADEGDNYGDATWGSFIYAPDEWRFGGARPFGFGVHDEEPSCLLEGYFWWTNPPGRWHTSGYFVDGYVNVDVK